MYCGKSQSQKYLYSIGKQITLDIITLINREVLCFLVANVWNTHICFPKSTIWDFQGKSEWAFLGQRLTQRRTHSRLR